MAQPESIPYVGALTSPPMLDLREPPGGLPGDAPCHGRIAVLEDDDLLREDILVPGLAAFGFEVEGFAHPAALYRRLLLTAFEVVVLDVGLPGEDGLSVARHLRTGLPVGIVMLTGCGDRGAQLRALGESADAWLEKPVDVPVVAATIASLLRRMRPRRADGAAAAGASAPEWRLAADGWRLFAPSGRDVALSRSERGFLRCLLAAGGEPVPREHLAAELGEDVHEFDPHRIEMLVHRLRRKVADQIGESLPLRTVRNRGYVLVARDRGGR